MQYIYHIKSAFVKIGLVLLIFLLYFQFALGLYASTLNSLFYGLLAVHLLTIGSARFAFANDLGRRFGHADIPAFEVGVAARHPG